MLVLRRDTRRSLDPRKKRTRRRERKADRLEGERKANDRLNREERRRRKKTTGKLGINGRDREKATEEKNRREVVKKGGQR